MKRCVLFSLFAVVLLFLGIVVFHQAKPLDAQQNEKLISDGYKQPPYVYFNGSLYFVRPRLFEKDVGEPSSWNVVGQITSSCGYENIPTKEGQINFDLNRLAEPIIYRSSENVLFLHLVENNVSPFRGLEIVAQN